MAKNTTRDKVWYAALKLGEKRRQETDDGWFYPDELLGTARLTQAQDRTARDVMKTMDEYGLIESGTDDESYRRRWRLNGATHPDDEEDDGWDLPITVELDIEDLQIGGHEAALPAKREALRACVAFLRDEGRATRSDFEVVYDEYPAYHDDFDGWWRHLASEYLQHISVIKSPPSGGRYHEYEPA